MVDLVSEQYSTLYFANKCSGAFIFCVYIYLFMIIVPLLIGFTTRDFWTQEGIVYQQPRISSFNEYILKIIMSDNVQYQFTNIPAMNSYSVGQVYLGMVHSSDDDTSLEQSKPRFYNATLQLKSANIDFKQVRQIQLVIFFKYELDEGVKLLMDSFAHIELSTPIGISMAKVVGQLKLSQRHPLQVGDTYRTRYNYSAYYTDVGALISDPRDILLNNQKRNESTSYNYNSYIVPAFTTSPSNALSINMIIQVPQRQKIIYQSSIAESAKFSWMQYFSIFLIFWVFGQYLLEFVVRNRVFETTAISNLPTYQASYNKLKMN